MENTPIALGSSAPSFSLEGTDGNTYTLESFTKNRLLLVVFSCNHCPYVQANEQRLIAIQRDYAARELQVIAINANDDTSYPEDSFANMVLRAKEKVYNFPYLRDATQETALAFGASFTPEIFLFDEKRALVYYGKIDDNWKDERKAQNHYLRNAIDEVLAGQPVSVPETYAVGCTIKWR